jgi:acyl-CoA thioesterase FadM
VLSAVLDETIGRSILVSSPDSWSVTVELALRYRKPVPLDREIRVLARMTRDTSRLFEGTGEILLEDGTVAVEASATYFKMPIERIAQRDFAEEWFPDDRENPESVVLP